MRYAAPAVLLTLLLPVPWSGTDDPLPELRLAAQNEQEPSATRQEESATRQEGSPDEQGPVRVHPEARKAIDRLKSPFCPGLMLEVCPSPQAAEMRDSLNVLAHEGVEADSLMAMVLATYGEEWRAMPEPRGRGLLAWLVPPALLLLGVVGLIAGLRRFTGSPATAEGPEISEEERRRLDEAMQELETEEEPLF